MNNLLNADVTRSILSSQQTPKFQSGPSIALTPTNQVPAVETLWYNVWPSAPFSTSSLHSHDKMKAW